MKTSLEAVPLHLVTVPNVSVFVSVLRDFDFAR